MGLLGALALGCGNKADSGAPAPASNPQPAAVATSDATPSATPNADTPASAPAQVAAANSVPAEEDYEDKAESQISAANAKAELDKLEKEIGK